MKLSAIKNDERNLIFQYGSEEVSIVYRPGAWTPETEAMLEESENIDTMLELLVDALVKWDITDDDGVPLPITLENLRILPSAFHVTAVSAIWEDMTPGEARRGSGGGSRRRGR